MDNCHVNIACVEPSDLVFEGLSNLLLKKESHFYIYRANDLDELEVLCLRVKPDLVVLNPRIVQNRTSDFIKLKKAFPVISWIGIIYSLYDSDLLGKFDDTFHLTDSSEKIFGAISRSLEKCGCGKSEQEELSEREIQVLLHLTGGLSNKEIADKLSISIHTVISHRKNIMEKTGIKSLPGLTIFAISRKLLPVDLS